MKMALAIKKYKAGSTGHCQSHNTRTDTPKSQIEDPAGWFFEGQASVTGSWRQEILDKAEGLAKRKDAVVALELVIQVGNQTDWRETPTAEHPYGKPKNPMPIDMKGFMKGAGEAIMQEFGKSNVVNIALHLDESTPHIHAVVVPIHDGKLNQKHWIGGSKAIIDLRERIHGHLVRNGVACEYERGGDGGMPHDPALGAGVPEKERLKAEIAKRDRELQRQFSKRKALESENARLKAQLERHGIKPEKPKPAPSRDMEP